MPGPLAKLSRIGVAKVLYNIRKGKMTIRQVIDEMFPANEAKVQFGVDLELFSVTRREDEYGRQDYTSHHLILKLLVVYAHFYVEHSRWNMWQRHAENVCVLNIYYGLGPDNGPASAIKRFKHIKLWERKVN